MTISESFLAMTIFRDQFTPSFILTFTASLLVKAHHWILRDRVEYMEQTPRVPAYFHARIMTAIYILTVIDLYAVVTNVVSVIKDGPSLSIYFCNEFALMFISLMAALTRYLVNFGDLRRGSPWEHRSAFLFYLDFTVDFAKLVIYMTFFGVVVAFYGLPIHIIRDLYLTLRSFINRVQDIRRYRLATRDMERRYPAVSPAELAAAPDRVCIVCREEMVNDARKLPCSHFFHFKCLRSWLERQQACPTCRRPVLEESENRQQPLPIRQNAPAENRRPADAQQPQVNQQRPVVVLPPLIHPNGAGASLLFRNPPILNAGPALGGAVPIIMVPPEQIARVRLPRENANRPDNAARRSSPNNAESHSESEDSTSPEENAFVLRQTVPGQPPIYLEKVNLLEEYGPTAVSQVLMGSHALHQATVAIPNFSGQVCIPSFTHLTDEQLRTLEARTRQGLEERVRVMLQLRLQIDTLVGNAKKVLEDFDAPENVNLSNATTDRHEKGKEKL